MKTQRERFDPGHAPVYPLPERQPWETFERWGMPPEPPVQPGAYERTWISPGPPPGMAEPARRGIPSWALACILAGSALLLVAAATILATLAG